MAWLLATLLLFHLEITHITLQSQLQMNDDQAAFQVVCIAKLQWLLHTVAFIACAIVSNISNSAKPVNQSNQSTSLTHFPLSKRIPCLNILYGNWRVPMFSIDRIIPPFLKIISDTRLMACTVSGYKHKNNVDIYYREQHCNSELNYSVSTLNYSTTRNLPILTNDDV